MNLQLADFDRSTAAWRVRIGLAWKGLDWHAIPIDLTGGEQQTRAHRLRNPQGLIPTLQDGDLTISQSLAILEYLEEAFPERPLLPKAAEDRARVRQLALAVACDVHPLQNLRVRRLLGQNHGWTENEQTLWCRHWIQEGLDAYETWVGDSETRFSVGDAPTLADLCLVPQLHNARRYGNDLARWPHLSRIEAHCMELPAFQEAAPH